MTLLKVVALAGGTGSAKILRGLDRIKVELTVVGNVGDNIWMHGVYVCPDLDIAMYSLAGVADAIRGWGIEGDTYIIHSQLARDEEQAWFKIGDRDLALCAMRTNRLRDGANLTEVTEELRKMFGVRHRILPATNDPLETRIQTGKGNLHLQEFWVRDRGKPAVDGVVYKGNDKASASREVLEAIEGADRIVVCPANPITSIGPIMAVRGMSEALSRTKARVSAVSPMIGGAPFSGPARKLMRAVGQRPDSVGVAAFYSDFLDSLIIDETDIGLADMVERSGVRCILSRTRMLREEDQTRLAREVLAA
jgi:LPPG:FO 2-phospho-L-lactate transferase